MSEIICRRFVPRDTRRGLRLEARGEGELPKIVGTGAVYWNPQNRSGTQYQLWDNVFERLQPGVFDKSVTRDDVRALQNHDPRLLLGRSSAGTLTLRLEPYGLDYEIDTPDTLAGRDTVTSLERKDLDGSSFSFRATSVEWSEETSEDGVTLHIRNLKDVETFDVGPVTFPAYSATSSGTRGFRSPACCWIDQRARDAEVTEVRAELDQFLRENYYEPQLEDMRRRLLLAEVGAQF